MNVDRPVPVWLLALGTIVLLAAAFGVLALT